MKHGARTGSGSAEQNGRQRTSLIWVCLLLIGLTLAVYWQTARFDFVNYDDPTYVTQNVQVRAGLTRASLAWAFTTAHSANWHPLTWISHMLDCRLFGLNPSGHHLGSVFLHLANSLLLLVVLRQMTQELWPSAFVAALFAIHPLHVESVAWVAERKDVLSTFFGWAALWFYVRYTKAPGPARYLAVLFAYLLSLMAKPMWVTFPFLLLLLDYWPLQRMHFDAARVSERGRSKWHLLREKAPLFAVAAVSCVVTYLAQQKGGAVRSMEAFSVDVRIQNAVVAYVGYLRKMVWPSDLAVFYPHPGPRLPMWETVAASIFLLLVTALVLSTFRQRPHLAVGWFWYLGTLVPVIGLVQVGSQAMADRYTYLPLVGIFVMLAWEIPSLAARPSNAERTGQAGSRRSSNVARGLGLAAVVAVLSFAICAWLQVGYWRDSVTLLRRALRVTSNNAVAHNNLGLALKDRGQTDEAILHCQEALRIASRTYQAHFNLASMLHRQGRIQEAITHYADGLRISPDHAAEENELAGLLYAEGRLEEAIEHYSRAVRLNPEIATLHFNLGAALAANHQIDQAIARYSEAIRIQPKFFEAHNNLGFVLARLGRLDEAILHFREALRINPSFGMARANLASVLLDRGNAAQAWAEVKLCRKLGVGLNPSFLAKLSKKMPEPTSHD